MNTTKHTPGPWESFYKAKYDEWHVSVPCSNTDMRVALFPDGIPVGDDPVPGEAEANARLIAAAPDLLAACKALAEANPAFRLKKVGYEGSVMRAQQDAQIAAEDLARAAIAKAKGSI